MKCRLIERTGTRYAAILTQPPLMKDNIQEHWHRAEIPMTKEEYDAGEPTLAKYRDVKAKCESCGVEFSDEHVALGGFGLYNTEDGNNRHPGDMYYSSWHEPGSCPWWDNCDGRHLVVVLPNGHPFDCDMRASNCANPNDRVHRCWRKEGTPPMVTLGNGCGGSCSIQVGNWHGHLTNGELVG